jgi:protein-tyrosine-phosphatase
MEETHLNYARRILPEAADRVHLLGEFDTQQAGKEVPDPYGGSLEIYRQCAQIISTYLEGVVDYLQENADGNPA